MDELRVSFSFVFFLFLFSGNGLVAQRSLEHRVGSLQNKIDVPGLKFLSDSSRFCNSMGCSRKDT